MGGPNLEVFKFGMYIMFPIGIMYYFGVNLDNRFATPDFWPKEGQTHTLPYEKEEIKGELERLRNRRLAARARRLASGQTTDAEEVRMDGAGVEEEDREMVGGGMKLGIRSGGDSSAQDSVLREGGAHLSEAKPPRAGLMSWFK
ncbi:hypothetical protein LTR66_013313 [Elasticomyces elasticus]|nr:hypothetical protein LTR66_013313 [Elasticomyces elasticus]KAK4964384.1 hypothetical protein LTR28_003780 [Elasticomyces elasticus]KAK4982494.1 hypothetical protein LTR50_007713 [Elasticomyces elasticus]